MVASVLIVLFGFASLVLGFFGGMECGVAVCRALRKQKFIAGLVVSGNEPNRLRDFLLRRGIVFLRPVAHQMLLISVIDSSMSQVLYIIDKQGRAYDKESILSLLIAVAVLVSLITGFLTASAVCGIAVGCCAIIGVLGFAHSQNDKHILAMRESVPEALRSMSACFKSGLSLVQTLRHVAHEIGGSLGDLFDIAARRLDTGASTTEALSVLRAQKKIPELVFVSVALDVQHQSGGSIAPVLEAARESVESELDLMRSLRVQTAQARLSSRIVTMMPFILIAIFSVMSPDFLAPFFESALGVGLLVLAFAMEIAGIVVVNRILKVETE